MVDLPGGTYAGTDVEQLAELFHARHEQLYSYALRSMSVDMSGWRLTALGQLPPLPEVQGESVGADAAQAVGGQREVHFPGVPGLTAVNVYDGLRLRPGMTIEGGGVVELPTTTITLFPQHRLEVLSNGNYAIKTDPTIAGSSSMSLAEPVRVH
jgi:N-methylhydantoinase A